MAKDLLAPVQLHPSIAAIAVDAQRVPSVHQHGHVGSQQALAHAAIETKLDEPLTQDDGNEISVQIGLLATVEKDAVKSFGFEFNADLQ